jgi:hypothetical protein
LLSPQLAQLGTALYEGARPWCMKQEQQRMVMEQEQDQRMVMEQEPEQRMVMEQEQRRVMEPEQRVVMVMEQRRSSPWSWSGSST